MRTGPRTLLIAFAILATLSAPAKALEIFGNPGLFHQGLGLPDAADEFAQGFTMGSNPYVLESVDIGLQFPTQESTDSIAVGLYANSGGSPNMASPIATFNNPAFTTGNDSAIYNFSYSGNPVTLNANTTYWLVVRYIGESDGFNWDFAQESAGGQTAEPTSGTSGSGVTYPTGPNFPKNGTQYRILSGAWTSVYQYRGLRYSVNVVPEPSTYALGLAGTLVLGTIARRRNRLAVTA